jgi:anti-sigma regulatory factor (Ser/Thr protein kinase)
LTNFFQVLAGEGLQIEEGHGPLNKGESPGLIKPSIVLTTGETHTNVETSVIVFDRLRRMLAYMDIDGHERAASVFSELSGNAAEHSQSPNGAFVMVQAYPNVGSIEIAVADVGRGIRAALGSEQYQTDAEAIAAALTEQVTGRRDAAGNPTEGGYGLPIVTEEADVLEIRSGNARLKSDGSRNARGELIMTASQVPRLDGTLVAAMIKRRDAT